MCLLSVNKYQILVLNTIYLVYAIEMNRNQSYRNTRELISKYMDYQRKMICSGKSHWTGVCALVLWQEYDVRVYRNDITSRFAVNVLKPFVWQIMCTWFVYKFIHHPNIGKCCNTIVSYVKLTHDELMAYIEANIRAIYLFIVSPNFFFSLLISLLFLFFLLHLYFLVPT